VKIDAPGGRYAWLKVPALVAGMVAGAQLPHRLDHP
jgi:hypothetical protein